MYVVFFEARCYKSPPLSLHYIWSFIQEREQVFRMTWGEKILTKWLRELSLSWLQSCSCSLLCFPPRGWGGWRCADLTVTIGYQSLSLSLPPPRASPLIFSLELRVRDKDPRPYCTRSHSQRSSACRILFFSHYYACVPDRCVLTCVCVEVYLTDTTEHSWWTKIPRL